MSTVPYEESIQQLVVLGYGYVITLRPSTCVVQITRLAPVYDDTGDRRRRHHPRFSRFALGPDPSEALIEAVTFARMTEQALTGLPRGEESL